MVGEVVDDFGERIKKARIEKNWTQKDLANEIKEREILIKRSRRGISFLKTRSVSNSRRRSASHFLTSQTMRSHPGRAAKSQRLSEIL